MEKLPPKDGHFATETSLLPSSSEEQNQLLWVLGAHNTKHSEIIVPRISPGAWGHTKGKAWTAWAPIPTAYRWDGCCATSPQGSWTSKRVWRKDGSSKQHWALLELKQDQSPEHPLLFSFPLCCIMFEHVKLWGNEIISGYNLLLFLHWIFFFNPKAKTFPWAESPGSSWLRSLYRCIKKYCYLKRIFLLSVI